MFQSRALAVSVILVSIAGCATPPPPQAAAPKALSSDDYSAMKAAYLSANPDSAVGRVAAVLPAEQRLAVSDLSVADFRKGDILSIVDSKLNPIADCSVVDVDADLVYVHYEPVTVGSPAPSVGDMAIRALAPDRPH